jgi:serine/alanine adding enzyme
VFTSYPLVDDSLSLRGRESAPPRTRRETAAPPKFDVRTMEDVDRHGWDDFAKRHDVGCLYHLTAWKDVIARSYAHQTRYVIARHVEAGSRPREASQGPAADAMRPRTNDVAGILPIAHVRHWLFGNSLVSLPFWDAAGVLADNASVEREVILHSLRLADEMAVPVVELRQYRPLLCLADDALAGVPLANGQREIRALPGWRVAPSANGDKVRMVMNLSGDAEALMRSFKAKLRSQIRRPAKEGLTVRIDGADLVDDFYRVFAANMRDLGSPVHSKRLIRETLESFPDDARVFVVYGHGTPMACGMGISFNGMFSNPWASSLRQYSKEAPNMLLYWSMLEYACSQGCRTFDFGRCTTGGGTYRFKCQWGAQPQPLYWYRFSRDPRPEQALQSTRMTRMVECWKRLPVPVTRVLGPRIRRYISL